MSQSERLATAAHLHVLLRRKTGRVTDTEWMAVNAEYAAEIVRFARMHAEKDGHADLAEWATRMEKVMSRMEPPTRRPLVEQAGQIVRERLVAPPVAPPAPAAPRDPRDPRDGRNSVRSGFGPSGFRDTGFRETGFRETGFTESTFGDDPNAPRRDPNKPRYVGGIR